MIITDVEVRVFRTTTRRHSDSAGHAHPGPAHQVEQAMLTIRQRTATRAILLPRQRSFARMSSKNSSRKSWSVRTIETANGCGRTLPTGSAVRPPN